MRTIVSLVLLLTFMWVPPTSGQTPSFVIPEETVARYYNLLFASFTHSGQNFVWWCQAYAQLHSSVKANLPGTYFLLAALQIRVFAGARSVLIGQATYDETRTVAKVPVTIDATSWLVGPLGQRTHFVTLAKEQDGMWRIVWEESRIQALRQEVLRTTPSWAPLARMDCTASGELVRLTVPAIPLPSPIPRPSATPVEPRG